MSLTTAEQIWLRASGLVDDNVDLEAVRLHVGGPGGWYLRLVGQGAITLGDHVFFREQRKRDDADLIVHELVHVGQYRTLGRLRFVGRYLRDWAQRGMRYSKGLPLEAPAYARQETAKQWLRAYPKRDGPPAPKTPALPP